jgi:SAM-dependent methyltransferase
MLELVRAELFEDVLEVGGGGRLACGYAPSVRRAVVFDGSAAAVAGARRLAERSGLRNVRFHLGEPSSLPYDDSTFDLVLSPLLVHRVDDPPGVVSELARVCRPGGRVALMDVALAEAAFAPMHDLVARQRDDRHRRLMASEEIEGLLCAAGLELIDGTRRDQLVEVHEWLGGARDLSIERKIAALLIRELHGGSKTGLRPVASGGRLYITERRVLVVGRKP